eukprot:3936864-Rhodomonas_salina.1
MSFSYDRSVDDTKWEFKSNGDESIAPVFALVPFSLLVKIITDLGLMTIENAPGIQMSTAYSYCTMVSRGPRPRRCIHFPAIHDLHHVLSVRVVDSPHPFFCFSLPSVHTFGDVPSLFSLLCALKLPPSHALPPVPRLGSRMRTATLPILSASAGSTSCCARTEWKRGGIQAHYFGYSLLALYLDNVLPDAMGVRKPPWYFLSPKYWWFGQVSQYQP